MLNVALFGPPGAGKGTQSESLVEEFNLFYISTGDLLRREIAAETKLGLEASGIIASGGLVSDEIIVQVIEKTITEHPEANGFLFDGFPRTYIQRYILEGLMLKLNTALSCLISLEGAVPTSQTLTVTKAGAGSGTVTSSPAGINCGSDCSESYASGTSVALTAAAGAGSTFAGWSGACSGSGGCAVTMSVARSVTATFNSATPAVTIYGDALAADWASWSWSATIEFNGTSPVHVGTSATNVTYQGWGGLTAKGTAQGTSGYTALKFWVYGGTGAAKSLRVSTQTADTGGESGSVVVSAPANTWTEITVPLGSLGNPASIKRLNIQENTGATQPMMTFDEIRLTP